MSREIEGFCICAPRVIVGDPRRYILVKEKINEQPAVAFVALGCVLKQDDQVNYVAERIRENEHLLPKEMPFKHDVCSEVVLDLNSKKCKRCKYGGKLKGNTIQCPSYSRSVSS